MSRSAALLLLSSVVLACAQSSVTLPAPLDTANEDCAYCRMRVSSAQFASQIVAPGVEPRFFDDLGCLVEALGDAEAPDDAVAYVADHRTREWVRAASAVYVRVPGLETPMGSHLIAHASAESRASDPAAGGGEPLSVEQVFGKARVPDGPAR